MKLQLALDTVNIQDALGIIEETIEFIDIVEIGTPMIIRYGIEPVLAVKRQFPLLQVLADLKIMDAGEYEANIAFEAGADIVTVMGVSHDETIIGTIKSARSAGKKILVDMMCVKDMDDRSKKLVGYGANYICVHTATDVQASESPYQDLVVVHDAVGFEHCAIAGGITLDTVGQLHEYKPGIVIVGGGITGQLKKGDAAAAIRKALG